MEIPVHGTSKVGPTARGGVWLAPPGKRIKIKSAFKYWGLPKPNQSQSRIPVGNNSILLCHLFFHVPICIISVNHEIILGHVFVNIMCYFMSSVEEESQSDGERAKGTSGKRPPDTRPRTRAACWQAESQACTDKK